MTLVSKIAELQDYKQYEYLHWTGSFEEYLDLVKGHPEIARTAYERLFDMILSHGTEEYVDNKKKITRNTFLATPETVAPMRSLDSTFR